MLDHIKGSSKYLVSASYLGQVHCDSLPAEAYNLTMPYVICFPALVSYAVSGL